MKTQQYQLTLYLPDDQEQPAVAARKDDAAPTKALSIREAAHLYTCKIKDLPVAEQPISRLQHYGAGMLSTTELTAILLSAQYVADADHILGEVEGLPGLAQMTFTELMALPAVGEVTAARIKAAFELGRRLLVAQPHERPVVRSPADAANMLMPEMGLLDQEELRVILLDTRNRILAIETLYRGNLNYQEYLDLFRSWTITHQDGLTIVEGRGAHINLRNLLLGGSDKQEGQRGRFGEGIKLGWLVLLREGVPFFLTSGEFHGLHARWTDMFGEQVMEVCWDEGEFFDGSRYELHYTGELWEERVVRPGDPRILFEDAWGLQAVAKETVGTDREELAGLNWNDPHTWYDQLTGVDFAYFHKVPIDNVGGGLKCRNPYTWCRGSY